MQRLRFGLITATVVVLLGMTSTSAVAAPKTGCPAERSGATEVSVETAGATIWAGLLDQSPWPGGESEFTELISGFDGNGDGVVCLTTRWGDQLNPNSHWYKVGVALTGSAAQLFTVHDNNANGSNA